MTDSLLYPRLPPAIASRLFEDGLRTPLERLRKQAHTSHSDAVFAALGGIEVNEEHLTMLAAKVRGGAGESGFPERPRTQEARDRFDLACAEILHREMCLVPAEAAVVDVWAFLGAVLVPDVCFWRFEDPPADRVIGPDLTRHTLARLWWRAYQLKDLEDGGGLSALTHIPENEMNQLFERRSIGGNRAVVRATARVLLRPDEQWQTLTRRLLVRDGLLRLRRLIAFMTLEALDEIELERLIRSVFDEAAAALTAGGQPRADAERSDDDLPMAQPKPPTTTETPDGGGAAHEDAELLAEADFNQMLLSRIPAQIATLVNELGGVPDSELVERYEHRFKTQVPTDEHKLVRRFAWSAKGRRFIELDEENELWWPGAQPPSEIEQLGEWTIDRVYERATSLLRADPNHDPFEQLVLEVYRSDGGRVPRLVMSLIGRIVNRARRDIDGRSRGRRQ
jgi:hypothetical protein